MPLKRVVRRRAPVRRSKVGGRLGIIPTVRGRKRVMGKGLMDWFNKAKDFVKSNQLLSKGASALGYNDVAGTLRNAGYGRRRVVRRRGRGFWDSIKSGFNTAKDFVKSNQLLSKGASALGYNDVAGTLRNAGYGRRRAPVRRSMMGGMKMLSPPFMGGMKMRKTVGVASNLSRRVGGRVVFPAVYTTGLGGLSATTA